MLRRTFVFVVILLLGIGIWVPNSQGQNYPTRPIEILCPYSAGSSLDIMIRLVADIAQKYLGQPVVVINKPGASGTLAAAEIITSKPDGHKLVELSNLFFATTTKTQKVPFDINDLEPLVYFMELKHGFSVKGDSPWKTLSDLIEYTKKNPGKLRWAHVGRGGPQYLYGTLMFRKAGVETIDVPYKGSPEQISAVLGGHIDASVSTYGPVKDLLKTGRLRYLTVFSNKRYSDPSEIPCVAELGYKDAGDLPTLFGLCIHKNTSEEIKKTLIETFRKTYENPEFKIGIDKLGEEPRFGGPELMKEAIKKSERVGVPILKELGLYIEQK